METTNFIVLAFFVVGLFLLARGLIPFKGKVGETIVAGKLNTLPSDRFRVFNGVTIPTPRGSSQIDHIVVSIYGIFVIETKNYKGWIYGGEHAEYWTQNIYGKKYQLYNPILQNAGHIRALHRALKEYEPLPILSIVAFSGRASLKVNVKDAYVVYWSQIITVINQFEETRLTWAQVNAICDSIQAIQLKSSKEVDRKHHKDVRSAQEQKYDSIVSGRCPRCGGTLVLRSGKYGQFYGCSNYPNCRFTHSV